MLIFEEFFHLLTAFVEEQAVVADNFNLENVILFLRSKSLSDLDDANDSFLLYLRGFKFYADLMVEKRQNSFDRDSRKNILLTAKEAYLNFYTVLFNFDLISKESFETITLGKPTQFSREQRISIDNLSSFQKQNNRQILNEWDAYLSKNIEELSFAREFLLSILNLEYEISCVKYNSILLELEVLTQEPNAPSQNSSIKLPFNGSPFTILPSRENTQQKVFGLSHRLPTMTIDELLELERKRGRILSSSAMSNNVLNNFDCETYDDVQVYKDRAFDEFKDENPRGIGNRFNRS